MGVWPNAMGVCGALVVMMSVTGIAMEERHLDAKEKAAKEDSIPEKLQGDRLTSWTLQSLIAA